MNLILYGPPGVGKSAAGRALAIRLGREFVDCDPLIEARTGLTITEIFQHYGQSEFRRLESDLCAELADRSDVVIAPGGGALLNASTRRALERTGLVVCLRADVDALVERLAHSPGNRPLLPDEDVWSRLTALLEARRGLYDSFPIQVDTTGRNVEQVADEIAGLLAPRRIPVRAPGLEHDIVLGYGLLEDLGQVLVQHSLAGPAIVVTDENVAAHFSPAPEHPTVVLPAGEAYKTLESVRQLYDAFLRHGLDRSGVVIALGGGVVGDLTGFAAATYLRGVRWVNLPTTLLAMVDASLGGKTGVDLSQGKNLVGAFHPPALVVSDPRALQTLPEPERIAGMAEVVKHGVIGDPQLLEWLGDSSIFGSLDQLQRAIQVKVRVVEADPFEKGGRARLNLGHTIGHGVEAASDYTLRHGEAVAIGLAAEARLAEEMGLAEAGLAQRIAGLLARIGLPLSCPGLDPAAVRAAMQADKKKAGGQLKFALPRRAGQVDWGVAVDEDHLMKILGSITR